MHLRTFLLLLSAVATLGFSSCDNKPSAGAGSNANSQLFVVSFQTLNNPFFVDLNEGLKEVITKNKGELITLDAGYKSDKQRSDISDLLQRKPRALFINPVNWEGIKGTLIEAKKQGVPVIVVDAPVSDPDLVLCQVASDNVEAGRLACEALAKVNPNAKVAILHVSVNKACIDRVDGFKAEMAKNPGIKILDTQECKGSSDSARPVMGDLLARFPELDAVFPINDPSAIGCISAIEAAGRAGKVTIVTVDGSREGATKILEGKLHSTSAQYPKEIGRIAAEKAFDSFAGKAVEKNIKVPVKLITKENASEILNPK